MVEIWKDIPSYRGYYQASNMGNIRSCDRFTSPKRRWHGRVLKPYINKSNGYCYVSLSMKGKREGKRVHVLVMSAFNPRKKKKGYDKNYTINHIDGIKTNNCINNLEWCTQSDNQRKAYKLGLNPIVNKRKVVCLDNGEIFESLSDAVRFAGGRNSSAIVRVCQGKRSQYRDWHFAYYDDYIKGSIPAFKGKPKRSCVGLWR